MDVIKDIVNKVENVLFRPSEFFSNLREEDVKNSFIYFAAMSLFYVVMRGIISGIFHSFNFSMMKYMSLGSSSISILIFEYIAMVVFGFVSALLLHVWILIFGGKGSYVNTYQIYAYGSTPSLLLAWIPIVNMVVWIYSLYVYIVGTEKLHKVSRTRALWIYITPLLIILLLLLAVFWFLLTSGKLAEMLGGMM